jgi:hypothetical protein
LLKSADEDEIDRIAGQTISRDRVSRDKPPMKNLQGQSDHVRQDDVSSQAICKAGRKNPWKSVIRSIEYDEDYQPNAKYTQTKNQEPLEKARQQSHNTFSRLASDELAVVLALRHREFYTENIQKVAPPP